MSQGYEKQHSEVNGIHPVAMFGWIDPSVISASEQQQQLCFSGDHETTSDLAS